ncbi:MAG: hypothetical protein SFT91_04865 [Rickettsiaceae bacterium]|nr:hypothetical protein [Rickettsiaceae bacterium]
MSSNNKAITDIDNRIYIEPRSTEIVNLRNINISIDSNPNCMIIITQPYYEDGSLDLFIKVVNIEEGLSKTIRFPIPSYQLIYDFFAEFLIKTTLITSDPKDWKEAPPSSPEMKICGEEGGNSYNDDS